MLLPPPRPRSVAEACALGPALVTSAALATHGAILAAALVDERVVLLGARQRRSAVLRRADSSAARVLRRSSSGPEWYLEGPAVWFVLALARVDALAADATAETLLNRNVRGFLKGLGRAAGPALYFGRDTLALRGVPFALTSFDALPTGALYIDLLVPLACSAAVPAALLTDAALARRTARLRGRALQPYGPVEGGPEALALRVQRAHTLRWERAASEDPAALHALEEALAARVRRPPEGGPPRATLDEADASVRAARAAPIGLVEALAAGAHGRCFVATDGIVPGYVLDALEAGDEAAAALRAAPLEGLSLEDLRAVLAEAARPSEPAASAP